MRVDLARTLRCTSAPRLAEGLTLAGNVVAFLALAVAGDRRDPRCAFIAALLAVSAVRFLLLPGADLRFFVGPAVLAFAFAAQVLHDRLGKAHVTVSDSLKSDV